MPNIDNMQQVHQGRNLRLPAYTILIQMERNSVEKEHNLIVSAFYARSW